MEVLGAIASIITIIELVGATTKTARKLTRFRDCKETLRQISRHVTKITTDLGLLKSLEKLLCENKSLIASDELSFMNMALQGISVDISEAYEFCVQREQIKNKATAIIKWAFHDNEIWKRLALQLEQAENRIGLIMQVIQIKLASQHESRLADKVDRVLELLIIQQNRNNEQSGTNESDHNSIENSELRDVSYDKLCFKWAFQWIWLPLLIWPGRHGFRLVVTASENKCFSSYYFTLKAFLPTFQGDVSLSVDLILRFFSFDYPRLSYNLGVNNIIPDSSEIITACRAGNLARVQDLFLHRRARPNDMTDDFRPLLWHAIHGGSKEVVSYLIRIGADAQMLSGLATAGLLHIAFFSRRGDIARILINHHADIEQINSDGVTPIFHLFQPHPPPVNASSAYEFLQILANKEFSGLNMRSDKGWTPLHRAAAYGTKEDIEHLLQQGALHDIVNYRLQRTPIFVAVEKNNYDTFERLLLHPKLDHKGITDARGWTLLHLAAEVGNPRVVTLLLKHGYDPHAVSEPGHPSLPKDIRHFPLTPCDIARYFGKLNEYSIGLESAGLEITKDCDDIFWSYA